QFAGILARPGNEYRVLPAVAGGHTCTGQPQPYRFNPLHIHNQRIDEGQTSYLRDSNIRHGDSGAPIFLEDGRVAGLVSEIGFGEYDPGTKIISSSAIVNWLVSILQSNGSLRDEMYSLESWPENRNIDDALNPDTCFRYNQCIPNVRLASELQRIPTNGVNFDKFTSADLGKLKCPV